MNGQSIKLFFAGLVLLAALPATAAAKDTWTSVRSKNFFLIGNTSEKEIRQVATRLEQFRHVFSRLFKRARLSDAVPTTVVVFKDAGSYKPFNPGGHAGYFQSGEEVNYITLNAKLGPDMENPFGIIFHEYMHLLVKNNVAANTPAWVNEGLAEFYSTLEVTKGGRAAEVGRPIAPHVFYLRQQKLLPLATLFAVDHSSPHYNEKSKRGVFYAQSWALVHYLMFGKERQRQPQLNRYMDLARAGVSPEESFKQAFAADAPAIEKELRDYIRRDEYTFVTFPFEERLEFDAGMTAAPLTEGQALGYLGDLALHTRLPELAETHLQKALALEADNAMAHASLGVLRARQRRFAEAKEHLGRAVAADARNHLAHYYYAHTLSREGMDETGLVGGYTEQAANQMRAALAKAIKLKPDFAEAYHLAAFVNLVTGEQIDESIELLKRAIEIAPGREEFTLSLAQLHLRKQDFAAARKLIEPLAQSSTDAQLRANAQSLLNNIVNFEGRASRLQPDSAGASAHDDDNASPASGEGPPRLLRRGASAGAQETGKTPDELVADALSEAVLEALRKPLTGEARAQGLLARLECDAKGIVFHVRVGGRVLKLRSAGFDGLHVMAFTQEAGGQISCGARKPESLVVVTYRAASDARAKSDGEMVALEFVPAAFVLKQ
ncbi:MAG TPA: DUF1570 domain-containing protein [Pyrinomonadaceae bacterium]